MPDLNDDSSHPLDDLLEDARMAAATDWEENFVDDMLANRKRWGARWTPTAAQEAKLRQIAEGHEPDMFEDRPRFCR